MNKRYAIDITNKDIKEFMQIKGISKSEITLR